MNTPPPPFDPSDDADDQYRRASERDPSRPSEATRRAVLEHAARLAAERARRGTRRRWLPLSGVTLRWQAIVGTVAAASLAGVMIAPQFLLPTVPSESERAAATAPPARGARQEPAPAPAPVEAVHPANMAVAPERARVAPSAPRAPPRETAPAEAAPAAPAPERAASDALTTLQLEQRAAAGVAAVSPVVAVRPPLPAAPQGPAGPEALRRAAAAGDLAALEGALAGSGDVDARDAQGRTALMLATLNGRADAVAELLAHGADPSGADAHGTTPLQAAVAADEREIIAMLRRYGAR